MYLLEENLRTLQCLPLYSLPNEVKEGEQVLYSIPCAYKHWL